MIFPDFFYRAIQKAGIKFVAGVSDQLLKEFFDRLDILPVFKSYIDDVKKRQSLKHEMFTKARAKNSLAEVTIADMDDIYKSL